MIHTLFKKNGNYHIVYGLIDGTTEWLPDGVTKNPTPTYVNTATGTIQVKDPSGALVVIGAAGATSANATYIGGSNGDYLFPIKANFDPPVGSGYKIIIDLTASGMEPYHKEADAVVKIKTGD